MNQGDGMADVTEADRERAREVLRSILVGPESTTVEIVAAALAEERQKARAPFLALAEELDAPIADGPCAGQRPLYGGGDVAYRIHRAAEEIA